MNDSSPQSGQLKSNDPDRSADPASTNERLKLENREKLNNQLKVLMGRCVSRDQLAFKQLYDSTSSQLYAILCNILRTEAVAEEALQEVYVKIWDQASDYKPEFGQPITWMTSISRYHALDILRQRSVRENKEVEWDDGVSGPESVDSLEPKQPPSSVWDGIAERLNKLPEYDSSLISLDAYKEAERQLESKADGWRTFAGLAAVACIALASLAWIIYSRVQDQSPVVTTAAALQYDSIAIIRDDQSLPLWIVDTALGDGLVRVTALAPPAIDDSKTYQLWLLKPDDAGVQSMGLIPTNNDQSYLLNVDATSDKPVTFAVSLEAAGGSLDDVPIGPVLYWGVVQSLTQ